MYTYRRLTVIYLILAASSNCYSQAKVPGLDAGTIKDSTYTNAYFAMKLRIPDGWQVQDNQATRALLERGRALVVGDDKNLDAMINASEQKSLTLLTMFKYPPGSPVDFNPAFICLVERLDGLPGIKKGSDYLFHVRKGLLATKLQLTMEKEIYAESVSGMQFDILETKLALGTTTVHQKYYSTILKGYALSLIISYTSDEELKAQTEIIKSMKFQ
jgi:hypothetical protein